MPEDRLPSSMKRHRRQPYCPMDRCSSASPTITTTSRGHLFHFDTHGNYVNAYSFGWDSTAGVYQHDGTYSIVIKDNHYPSAGVLLLQQSGLHASAGRAVLCFPARRQSAGGMVIPEHDHRPPASQRLRVVRQCAGDRQSMGWSMSPAKTATSTTVPQGHHGVFTQWQQKIFLREALGAAYTPLSIGGDGKVYSQNDGHLFVVGQ